MMKTREDVLKYGLTFANTYIDAPFHDDNWQVIRVKPTDKIFLWTFERDGYLNINVKVRPEWRHFFRDMYESVVPGWHVNKEHWNTIIMDGTVPEDDIKKMIDESYALISDSPTARIYEAVKLIPKGKVATYGQIAELAGDKKMARAVGNALHKNPDPDAIPCYRIVNAKGELAGEFAFGGAGAQRMLLEQDKIKVIEAGGINRVDLNVYGIHVHDGKILEVEDELRLCKNC